MALLIVFLMMFLAMLVAKLVLISKVFPSSWTDLSTIIGFAIPLFWESCAMILPPDMERCTSLALKLWPSYWNRKPCNLLARFIVGVTSTFLSFMALM